MHKQKRLLNSPFFRNNPETKDIKLYFKFPRNSELTPFHCDIVMPNFCPFENIPVSFKACINTNVNKSNDMEHFGVVFQCPSCQRYCVIDYEKIGIERTQVIPYRYQFIHPSLLFNKNEFNKLSQVSPHFKDVYIQAAEAGYYHLDQIYIMGYRKALEYLITGYLINCKGYKPSELSHKMLGKEISKLNDNDLQSVARVASYIGNDNTHVYKEHPKLGGEDMKQSLEAVAYLIMLHLTIAKDNKILNSQHKRK